MHKNKTRDIIRSILPSTRRRYSRYEKARINRANRHQVRQVLHEHSSDDIIDVTPDGWDIILDDSKLTMLIHDSDRNRARDTKMMVSERRGADKISHFVRWCEARTKHIPEEDVRTRYYTISGLIGGPADIIREHALGHFLNPEYDFDPNFGRSILRSEGQNYYFHRTPVVFTRDVFYKALKAAFESSKHKLLNRLCKEHDWRRCTDDDPCTSSSEKKVWLYRYSPPKASYRFQQVETSYPPRETDYKPGTLAHVLVSKIQHHHDVRICTNRIILNNMDDVDRLMRRIFGSSEEWHGRFWNNENFTEALCGFLVLHDFMYDYMKEQSK